MTRFKSIGLLCCAGLTLAAQEVQLLSLDERIVSLALEVRASSWDEAISSGELLLGTAPGMGERQRSEVHFATALARAMRAGEPQPIPLTALPQAQPGQQGQAPVPAAAEPVLGAGYIAASEDFESSRALAGPGLLRLSATYDLGTAALMRGELWRLKIPEIAQAGGQQPMAPVAPMGVPAPAAGGDEEQAPDPLAEARAAYLQAKERLILRLRSDWSDADNRANLELIQRRLRELDEIEEQRKQDEQESEDEQEDSEDKQEGEDGEEGEDQEEEQDQEGEQEQDDEQQEEGDEESEEPSEEEQQDEQEGEDERKDSEAEGGEAQSQEPEPAERVLTREEVIRLLDKLAELEAEAEALKAAQTKSQTVRVDRDW